MTNLPQETKAILLNSSANGFDLNIGNRKLKKPSPTEIIVKMMAAPINPSDLGYLSNNSGSNENKTPGFEGSGKVIYTGKKWKSLLNKNVACRYTLGNDGTWSEYLVTDGARCFPLPTDVNFSEGASMFINPLTAWGLVHEAKKYKHKAAIQTAGMSAVSHMMMNLTDRLRYPVIYIVRKSEDVQKLKSRGVKHVLNSEDNQFSSDLSNLAKKLNATVCFDAIGGSFTETLLKAIPDGGEVWSYGSLSGQPCQADHHTLAYSNKSLKGFWITSWQRTLTPKKMKAILSDISKHLKTDFKTTIAKEIWPRNIQTEIQNYRSQMSQGKYIINLSSW